jgi:hypothetical protein
MQPNHRINPNLPAPAKIDLSTLKVGDVVYVKRVVKAAVDGDGDVELDKGYLFSTAPNEGYVLRRDLQVGDDVRVRIGNYRVVEGTIIAKTARGRFVVDNATGTCIAPADNITRI